MALWDIAARVLTQLSSSAVGLTIKRFSSGATGDFFQCTDETGTKLSGIRVDGKFQSFTGIDMTVSGGGGSPCESAITGGDGTSPYQIWNAGGGQYLYKSYQDRLEIAAVRPGALNPYNSLTALKIAGLATAPGKPTSSTWVTGDTFKDSKGVDQLCTTGGTPGTWVSGGWQMAGFYKFASALATSGAVTVAAFDELMIVVQVVSMSAATEWPALRFNGDTATNYSHGQTFTTAGTSATDATATVTNRQQASAGAAKIAAQVSAGPRVITCVINNALGTSKVGTVVGSAIGTGTAATLPVKDISGQFEWVNTSAQITSVTMLTMASGANTAGSTTFGIGSGFQVFGRDFA